MELIRGLVNLQHQLGACVATIGNFDGVHLGHQAIVERLIKQAKKLGLPACVLLFEPHPKEYFLGDKGPTRLTCFAEKYRLLESLGVDKLLVLQFNRAMREMSAVDFVKQILIDKLKIKHLVVGDDFHFGCQRQGNYQLLEQMGQGYFSLEPTPSVMLDQQRVSSTLVREALLSLDLNKANRLLNRRYSMTGNVGYGEQLGRTIDFPTANVATKRRRVPLSGVFLVKCRWQQDGKNYSAWGAANCGQRPTVEGESYRLEVHLLDVSPSLYGLELSVEFYAAIRAVEKFAGMDELKSQISKDISQARKLILQYKE